MVLYLRLSTTHQRFFWSLAPAITPILCIHVQQLLKKSSRELFENGESLFGAVLRNSGKDRFSMRKMMVFLGSSDS